VIRILSVGSIPATTYGDTSVVDSSILHPLSPSLYLFESGEHVQVGQLSWTSKFFGCIAEMESGGEAMGILTCPFNIRMTEIRCWKAEIDNGKVSQGLFSNVNGVRGETEIEVFRGGICKYFGFRYLRS